MYDLLICHQWGPVAFIWRQYYFVQIPQPSITKISWKIIYLKSHSNIAVANELKIRHQDRSHSSGHLGDMPYTRVDSRFAPSQWETSLQSNAVSHWLDANLASATHYSDAIMGVMTSLITSLTIVYSTVYSDADQRKHQSSASLAFVWGIHRLPVNSPHKWPVTQKMFPFDDVMMVILTSVSRVLPGVSQSIVQLWGRGYSFRTTAKTSACTQPMRDVVTK